MKRRQVMRFLALASIPLTAGFAVGCAPNARSPMAGDGMVTARVGRDLSVGASPELIVDDQVGAVTVEAAETGKVSVEAIKRARSQSALDRIEVGIDQSGDVVRLTYRVPQGMGSIAAANPNVDFRVKVPASTKAILTTETGAIEVVGLTRGVSAKTTTGAITSRNAKGPQSLSTTTGAISVTGAGGTVQAAVQTGAIDVDGDLSGDSWARTQVGAVTIKLPASARLKVTAKGSTAQNDFGLASSGGQISGTIGDGTGGTLDVRSNASVLLLRQ